MPYQSIDLNKYKTGGQTYGTPNPNVKSVEAERQPEEGKGFLSRFLTEPLKKGGEVTLSAFERVLSPLVKIGQFGAGVAKEELREREEAFKGKRVEQELWEEAKDQAIGLINPLKRLEFLGDVITKGKKGIEEEVTGKDVLEETEFWRNLKPKSTLGRYGKGLVEFGTEVAVDPLTWTPAGFVTTSLKPLGKLAKAGATRLPVGVQKAGTILAEKGKEIAEPVVSKVAPRVFKPELHDMQRQAYKRLGAERDAIIDDVQKQYRFNKLTDREMSNLTDVLDRGAAPMNKKVRALATETRAGLDQIYDDLVERGLAKEEFRREFYFPHQFEKYLKKDPNNWIEFKPARRTDSGFLKKRSEKDIEGWSRNVPAVIARYRIAANNTMIMDDLVENLSKKYGVSKQDAINKGRKFEKGGEELYEYQGKIYKDVPKSLGGDDILLEKSAADDLTKFAAGDQRTIVGKAYDKAQNVWKSYVTAGVLAPNIGFFGRNILGNFWNNFLAGVINPIDYGKAAAIQISDSLAKRPMTEKAGIVGRRIFGAEKYDKLKELGAFGSGTTYLGVEKLLDKKINDNNIKKVFKSIFNLPFSTNSAIENNAKLAHMIRKLEKGASVDDAIKSMEKYLFDYDDLTDWEKKWGKRVIPFYAWMRKNIPLQIQNIVEQPAKFAGVDKAKRFVESGIEPGKLQEPYDWMGEDFYTQVPVQSTDPKTGKKLPVFWNPYMPFQDLGELSFDSMIGRLSPLLKTPISIAYNKDPFLGYEIFGEDLPEEVQNKQKMIYVYNQFLPRGIKEWSRVFDENKDRLVSLAKLFGFATYPVDPEKLKEQEKFQESRVKGQEKTFERQIEELEGSPFIELLQGQRGQEREEFLRPEEPKEESEAAKRIKKKYNIK